MDGGSTWSFAYNALGHRVQWAYPGGADQHFFDPEGNWLGNAGSYSLVMLDGRYFALYYGGNTLFNHVNALDSASMRTLQSGAEAEDILFYPWGDVWEVQGGGGYNFANIPYRDVTTTTDITTARFSSPNFGRWLSPDPIGKKAVKLNDPQTWNMYAYVRNSPATLTDPTGLWETGMQCGGNDTSPCEGGFSPCVMSADKPCGEEGSPQGTMLQWATDLDSSSGEEAQVTVTYDKNVPAMQPKTQEYVEKTVTAAGVDGINISATTNGQHAPNSNHYNGTAVDINKVKGDPVINAGKDPSVAAEVRSIQGAANNPKVGVAHENYGPAGLYKDGKQITNQKLQSQHENHIHITIPRSTNDDN